MLRLWPSGGGEEDDGDDDYGGDYDYGENDHHHQLDHLIKDQLSPFDLNNYHFYHTNYDEQCSATKFFLVVSVALMAFVSTAKSVFRRRDEECLLRTSTRLRELRILWSRWRTERFLMLLLCVFYTAAKFAQVRRRSLPSSSPSSSSSPSLGDTQEVSLSSPLAASSESTSRSYHHHRHYRRRCHHPFLLYHLHFSPSSFTSSSFTSSYLNLFLLTTLFSSFLLLGTVKAADGKASAFNVQLSETSTSSSLIGQGSDISNYEVADEPASQIGPPPSLSQTLPQKSDSNTGPTVMKEHVCGTIDIRNSVTQFSQLENCTVVEGYLSIVLIDNGTAKDFTNFSFPHLREITDYFLLFRIMGLQSLKRLFPNLAVIRGNKLLGNYALIIYEMLQLQEIGLASLTDIVRGDVKIEKNPNLCFVDTVDWTRIARSSYIYGNKPASSCPSCNTSCPVVSARRNDGVVIGDLNGRVCWTDDVCQKYACSVKCETQANQTCIGGNCCSKDCLGGCRWSLKSSLDKSVSTSTQVCLTCRRLTYQGRCYQKCPPGTYEYLNRRCITQEECHNIIVPVEEGEEGEGGKVKWRKSMKAFGGRCEKHCPVGYTTNAKDIHQCDRCEGECPKLCGSSIVKNIQMAQKLKGCTKITGSLEISISSGGAQIVKELEENLKDLTEIMGFLKVARSYPLITLNFLRNLKVIHGEKLERQSSLLVLDNPNLQDLWIFDKVGSGSSNESEKRIRILNGRPFFHINPKLCVAKIEKMKEYIDFGDRADWKETEVSPTTNGDKVPCALDRLGVRLIGVASEVVGLKFEDYKPKMDDSRTLLGYLIYYRESEHRNVSIFDGRDACSNNEWAVIEYDIDDEVSSEKPTPEKIFSNSSTPITKENMHIIPNLKAYTQYALYIKTYTLAIATRGAQSDIIYFKTMPSQPTPPRNLQAASKKHDEIEIRWEPPTKPNGEIDHYHIRVTRDEASASMGLGSHHHRDFCSEKSGVHGLRGDLLPSTTSTTTSRPQVGVTSTPPSEPRVNLWTNGSSDSQANLPWRKPDGKQCCTCKSSEKLNPTDIEQSINFEDLLLNSVYIRRSKDVTMNGNETADEGEGRRRRRDVLSNLEFSKTDSENVSSTTILADLSNLILPTEVSYFSFNNSENSSSILNFTFSTTTSSPSISSNITSSSSNTTMASSTTTVAPEPEKYEKNVTKYFRRLASFTKLVHFTEYTIEVRACQVAVDVTKENEACSVTAIASVRTLPLDGADDIDSDSVRYTFGNDSDADDGTLSKSLRVVHLRWDEPQRPNGIITSYNVQHMRVTTLSSSSSASSSTSLSETKKPTMECISRESYLQSSPLGVKLELTPGNHSVQVRARSLFGPGAWTREMYVFVEEPPSGLTTTTVLFVLAIFLLFVVAIVGAVLYYYRNHLKKMKIDYISVNPEYMSSSAYVYNPDPKWEVPRENVELIRELGQGSFGMVYEGTMLNEQTKDTIRCAIKTVNDNSSTRVRFDFLKEADVMKSFTDCYHVVKLLGIVSKDAPVYVLMEIMPRGDLRKYLRDNRPDNEENLNSKPPALEQLYKIAIEIADGMAYLASKKFVHRDLAARNCMVADDLTVKIGDFGMTRDIYETDYYRKGGKGLLPVRWMSPESLKDGIFTTYSDVWSYGIVLWEMATLASQPYQGLSNEEVLKFVVDGGVMTKPQNCPEVLWDLMCKTWERKPKSRPTFPKIVEMMLEHLEEEHARPKFLALSYYQQWKNSRTEKDKETAATAVEVEVEVASPPTEQMEIDPEEEEDEEDEDEEDDSDDDDDSDDGRGAKDESLMPLRKHSKATTFTSGEEYSTDDEDEENDDLNEEDTNVHFFPLSRDLSSDVRLFNEPATEEVAKDEKKQSTSQPSKNGSKGELPGTSYSPMTLNVQSPSSSSSGHQGENKSVSLIGLHELLPRKGQLQRPEEEKKKSFPVTTNNNHDHYHHPHYLSANPLMSSSSPSTSRPQHQSPLSTGRKTPSPYSTSNVDVFSGQQYSLPLAANKSQQDLKQQHKGGFALPSPLITSDIDVDFESEDSKVGGSSGDLGPKDVTKASTTAPAASGRSGLINGHLIGTNTTTSMV